MSSDILLSQLILNRKTFLAGHDASLWILVFLITFSLVHTVDGIPCPATRISWEKRAKGFNCDTNQSYVYHCILDVSGSLVETCAARVPVPQGKVGCPRIFEYQGITHHMDGNTECPTDNDNCPSGNNAYYTDQLYLYPICFLPENQRSNYTQENNEDSTEKIDTTEMAKDTSVATIILVILFAVSLTLNVSLAILYFCRRRRKKYKKLEATNQSNGIEGDASTKLNGKGQGDGDGESSQLNTFNLKAI